MDNWVGGGVTILRVAVDAPLHGLFDYRAPEAGTSPEPGCRVRVPFGRRRTVGLVMALAESSTLPAERLKPVLELLDDQPLLDPAVLALLSWAARYYHHPAGEVMSTALPGPLKRGAALPAPPWRLAARGPPPDALAQRAPRQAELLAFLAAGPRLSDDPALPAGWRATAERLVARGLLELEAEPEPAPWSAPPGGPALTGAQADAVARIEAEPGFAVHLLHGVTGSGKTEVYLAAAARVLARGRQVLVLVPEIALTPQLVSRFAARLAAPVSVYHSGLAEGERLRAWSHARSGRAAVVIGTRSAAFVPLARPGLFVVDEEHDPSLKQQEGFRYSGRDLAVMRARLSDVPLVMGSATPSLESLHNARRGRYQLSRLPERPGAARHPDVRLVDLRRHPARDGLSGPLLRAMATHLDAGGQVLLFLNRRGYAPALFCTGCGWTAGCSHCDARLVWHRRAGRLACHHCGQDAAVPERCPVCQAPLSPVGEGTERLEDVLARHFPAVAAARIDRDSTRRRGEMERLLDAVQRGETRILVGTQMLAKGHDFPEVTLVGVVHADQGLFGTDFRAGERLAQTLLQVAGRAGRADRPGEVLVQTAYPEHPLLARLLAGGYEAFAEAALAERRHAGWPPYSHLALLRAEAGSPGTALEFLAGCRARLPAREGVTLLGPAPAPMEKRGGRWRAQLLLQSARRRELHASLDELEALTAGAPRVLRLSLEVDPQELF